MDEKRLGARLQAARKRAGYTQQELCQQSGLSYSTLAKIERGAIKSPSVFTVQQIAVALNTSFDALLGIKEMQPLQAQKKRSANGISFVYFDINGCLVRFYHRAFSAAAEAASVSTDRVESVFWHYNDAVCRGDMPMEEFNEILSERLEMPGFDWGKYYLGAVEPIEETAELVKWASQHYKVGLLSNIMPGMIDCLKQKGYIPDIKFDAVIDSSKTGSIKPESGIYAAATQTAGVPEAEILLVDDSRANLIAAEKCGWKVLWFGDYHPKESIERVREVLKF